MKAILVIDMPDNLKNHLDKVKVDVRGTLNGQELFHRLNQPLKPMPEKKDLSFNELNFEEGYIKEGCTHGWKDFVKEKLTEYDMGYNKCIDDILEDR